ncbi:MAG: GNAT family N-acetyltransferase [Nanoarchaeota archaeon]
MKIRKATMKDAPKILRLFNKEKYLSLSGEKNDYDLDLIKEYLSKKIMKILVCEEDGKICGVAIAHFWEGYINLDMVVVDENFRGKGVGKFLMDGVENAARKEGVKWIESITNKKNNGMQKLFEKLNYKKGGEFIAYFKRLR